MAESETFAVKLQRLMEASRNADGTRPSAVQIADDLTSRGHRVSKTYIYDLVGGKKNEPSHSLVQALSEYFAVPLDYFSNSDRGQELARQYDVLAALGESNVQQIARRAQHLSPDGLKAVLSYIDFQATQEDTSAEE